MGIRNMIGAAAMAVGAMATSPAMAELQFDRIQLDNGDLVSADKTVILDGIARRRPLRRLQLLVRASSISTLSRRLNKFHPRCIFWLHNILTTNYACIKREWVRRFWPNTRAGLMLVI